MILIPINGSSKYEEWVYRNCSQWRWHYASAVARTAALHINGVWLEEKDATAFKLVFNL